MPSPSSQSPAPLGVSGRLAGLFVGSKLTPLIIIASLLLGLFAVLLTPREEEVLAKRFGLADGTEHTLEEVGRIHNVTRERIRQIESKALRKLRHPSRAGKLKPFLDTGL